jgi:hypothetical protein
MNNTTTKTLAIVAIFMAATLVVGGTFTAIITPSAFASQKRQDSSSKNGNTNTPQEIDSKSNAIGFDARAENEPQNQICTRPNNNAACSQEGVTSILTPSNNTVSPQPPTITQVNGQGEGQNVCPQSITSLLASITFSAHLVGNTVQGQFNIVIKSGNTAVVKAGTLNGLQITGNSFTATGTESEAPCDTSVGTPSATISGQCGTGVTILFQTADGEHATFTGNVNCT